ncbi:MAG: restriction endonuclease subunit S [Lachnospiraceae bacterium]|nr:restriction endonuclease subunit S [Lachnospiraceae bacterium]
MIAVKQFHNFTDWSVDKILFSKEFQSCFTMETLANIIKPRRERIKPPDVPKNRKIVSKIRFADGKVSFNDRVIKNDMYKSCINDLLVSNINFEKGAFAVNIWGDVYASTDYTSYIINLDKIIPEYLQVTLRSKTFLQHIASVKPKGMKTRARYEFIRDFSIPLPSILEQQKLLNEYNRLLSATTLLKNKAEDEMICQLINIQKDVSAYSKPTFSEKRESLLNIIHFTSANRWEVDYIYKSGTIDSVIESFKHPAKSIEKLQKESLFGLSVKASPEQKDDMIPMLRMANIKNGEIHYNELKYLPYEYAVTDKESEKWLLQKGDFLITRTNGSKHLVGKAAVFDSNDIYTYASYLIRYRFDTEIVLPEYVSIMFMTPIVREQIAVLRRQSGGQYNLNSDEINSIRIPVPADIQVQRDIIQRFQDSLAESKKFKKQANDTINNANEYLEISLYR